MTTTALALADDGDDRRPAGLTEKMEYAKALSLATLLPKAYQRQPGNLLLAQEYAAALDLPVMTVVQSVYIVDGRPTASAQLIGALVRRAGHRLRVTGTDTAAVAEIVRCDDPEFTFRSEWTLDRARAAGLAGKGTWKAYPAAMLKARAITEVARDACPEALSGVAYTPEELGAPVDRDGAPVAAEPLRPADPGTDWAALVDAASTVDEVRAVWRQAKDAHQLTTDLSDRCAARVAALQAEAHTDAEVDVVDAVEVDPETGEVIPAEVWDGAGDD